MVFVESLDCVTVPHSRTGSRPLTPVRVRQVAFACVGFRQGLDARNPQAQAKEQR